MDSMFSIIGTPGQQVVINVTSGATLDGNIQLLGTSPPSNAGQRSASSTCPQCHRRRLDGGYVWAHHLRALSSMRPAAVQPRLALRKSQGMLVGGGDLLVRQARPFLPRLNRAASPSPFSAFSRSSAGEPCNCGKGSWPKLLWPVIHPDAPSAREPVASTVCLQPIALRRRQDPNRPARWIWISTGRCDPRLFLPNTRWLEFDSARAGSWQGHEESRAWKSSSPGVAKCRCLMSAANHGWRTFWPRMGQKASPTWQATGRLAGSK